MKNHSEKKFKKQNKNGMHLNSENSQLGWRLMKKRPVYISCNQFGSRYIYTRPPLMDIRSKLLIPHKE